MADEAPHLDGTEARGASTPGVVRYILGASVLLVVVIFAAIFFRWL